MLVKIVRKNQSAPNVQTTASYATHTHVLVLYQTASYLQK